MTLWSQKCRHLLCKAESKTYKLPLSPIPLFAAWERLEDSDGCTCMHDAVVEVQRNVLHTAEQRRAAQRYSLVPKPSLTFEGLVPRLIHHVRTTGGNHGKPGTSLVPRPHPKMGGGWDEATWKLSYESRNLVFRVVYSYRLALEETSCITLLL